MTLQYWYMLPVAVLIASIAMASGVGGCDLFLAGLYYRLAPATGSRHRHQANHRGFFGFASGLFTFARSQLIDYRLGLQLLMVIVPLALLGTWVAGGVEPDFLRIILGVGLFAVAASFLRAPEFKDVLRMDQAIKQEYGGERAEICLISAGGEEDARHGPSLMPGGSLGAWPHVKSILQSIAAKVADGTPCCDWIGETGIPLTLIAEAVFARFLSALKAERVAASQVLAGPEATFEGGKKAFIADSREALYASKIISYTQGYMLFRAAAAEYGWNSSALTGHAVSCSIPT